MGFGPGNGEQIEHAPGITVIGGVSIATRRPFL